jgi:6-phosphofructokinase 1
MVKGKLIGGFAVVAWPAEYGSSGIMTFITNHQGIVYQKDLGEQTDSLARRMAAYNPGTDWKKENDPDMSSPMKRIAICTGIHAAVHAASGLGWAIVGIREGYDGLMEPQNYPDGGLIPLTCDTVRSIAHLGGTILGTTNRGNPFKHRSVQPDGSVREVDRSDELIAKFREQQFDALISVGGDGSLGIANQLSEKGISVMGVPKTIDNDLEATTLTFGFDTAVSFATECIDRLHSTAESHRRIIVVEVMGRYAGWIALHSGIAGRADAILIPEIPYDIQKVAEHIRRKWTGVRQYSIVVVAEGAKPRGGGVTVKAASEAGRAERLGGIGETVATQLQQLTGRESRAVVLGHLLRGGSPTSLDRLLGLNFGAAAVRGLAEGKSGVMVALNPPLTHYVPLKKAIEKLKLVPLNGSGVITARALDIGFGD